ncbi:unnamed protein product [Owenia fusiformis]|uniref:Uncharacterized protein n=1 Tax=Owenia fusiformis TaxID=6347 RepID=A0A8S4PKF5_OWEFU|nr:unnamed protein product [Owenia fusiformis]
MMMPRMMLCLMFLLLASVNGKAVKNLVTDHEEYTAGKCLAGYYCPTGSLIPLQCPQGHYCPEGSTVLITCPSGHYCPQGSTAPTGCPSGFYCPREGNASPIACPIGYFCPQGSTTPTPCPIGTYSDNTHIDSIGSCIMCAQGFYCRDMGQTAPTGSCDAGYYCPVGSTVPNPVDTICPTGTFCPQGSGAPTACPAGYYCPKGKPSASTNILEVTIRTF